MSSMSARPLAIGDVDRYLDLVCAVEAESGLDGAGHSHAYTDSEPFDVEAGRDQEVARWSTEIDEVGWRRAWGLFDEDELVGNLCLVGGLLRSELHRANVGMGVTRSHRRQRGGSLLLATAIGWARRQLLIHWIDLSVFSDNPGAEALYARHGFQVVGRTPDRFRLHGRSLDDIAMTLHVARPGSDDVYGHGPHDK
jgi:RimJ/RimL family protein N-acetyltransferase